MIRASEGLLFDWVKRNNIEYDTQETDAPRTVVVTETPFPTAELVDIVVAVEPIERGAVISPSAIRMQPWPLEAAPFDAIGDLEDVIWATSTD